MSSGIRRILNLGLFDGVIRAYSLRRLDLTKTNFFYPTAEEVAAHGKVVPTLTPAKACATNRRRICNTNLAVAVAAAPKIDPPKSELVIKPPQVSYSLRTRRSVHFLPTASENKVVLADRGNRVLRFDIIGACRCIDTLPSLHGQKNLPLAISVPPTDLHLHDGEDTGDLYIINSVLHPDKAEARPQFEALLWKGLRSSPASHRFWHCDILPLPPWISHHRQAFVLGHALVGNTICFSIAGAEGAGTYCFHIETREWSKAGDWLMPFHGKADYAPELGLWFGVSHNLPCAADLSGVLRGEEVLPEKMRIWAHDELPEEWQPNDKSKVVSLGSGRFIFVDFLNAMVFDKDSNDMSVGKQFALFTGFEVAYSNGKGNGNNGSNCVGKDNGHHNSGTDGFGAENGNYNSDTNSSGNENGNYNSDTNGSGNENGNNGGDGSKRKGIMRGLRMIKHKSGRYIFNKQRRIETVL